MNARWLLTPWLRSRSRSRTPTRPTPVMRTSGATPKHRRHAGTRFGVEELESRLLPALFTVLNTADSGAGSLRQAILNADAAGADVIQFNIPGAGPHVIALAGALPELTDTAGVLIDGYSQPGASPNTLAAGNNAVLKVVLDGSGAGALANGLLINGGSTTVRGLEIRNFDGNGIVLKSFAFNRIEGNFIHGNAKDVTRTDINPTPGINGGIRVNVSINVIGGDTPAARNVISGNNRDGVYTAFGSNNVIRGNFIGTNFTGTAALGNRFSGVVIGVLGDPGGSGNQVMGNVISGNSSSGVEIGGPSARDNLVQANLIGTDATGTAPLGNNVGLVITDGIGYGVIGNVISANHIAGVFLFGGTGHLLQGNFIGTDATGTAPLGNDGMGLVILDGIGNRVIGNVISANDDFGILIEGANNNTIGGTASGEGNVIAFNAEAGIWVVDGAGNAIRGNSIFSNVARGVRVGWGSNWALTA